MRRGELQHRLNIASDGNVFWRDACEKAIQDKMVESFKHNRTVFDLSNLIERYEVALRLIANVPKDHHVQHGDLPPWESTILLDGHDQCVEIAKRALEGEV